MNKIIKCLNLIREGYSVKDKFVLMLYFVKVAINRISNLKENRKLIYDVMIKNEDGKFYCGDNINSVWVASIFHEKEIRDYFNLKKGIFVDIGSNIGKYTVRIGRQLKDKGKVISIEPEPNNFDIIKKNVRMNKLNNVILENLACSSRKGVLNFYLKKTGTGGHSLVNKTKEKIKVKAEKLDSILSKQKIKKADLIKIDVEGAEAEVLKGARKTLKEKPKIIFEAWNKSYLDKIENILKKYNYRIKRISTDNYLAE